MNLYNILNTLQLHHKKTTHSARMRTDNHESLSTILLHPIFHLLIMEKLELVSKPFDVHCKSQQTMLKPKPLEKHRFISSTILEDLSDFFFTSVIIQYVYLTCSSTISFFKIFRGFVFVFGTCLYFKYSVMDVKCLTLRSEVKTMESWDLFARLLVYIPF